MRKITLQIAERGNTTLPLKCEGVTASSGVFARLVRHGRQRSRDDAVSMNKRSLRYCERLIRHGRQRLQLEALLAGKGSNYAEKGNLSCCLPVDVSFTIIDKINFP